MENLKQILLSKSSVLCWMMSILGVLLYFVFFHIIYEQNDDLAIQFIANGYFTGTSDFHLVFINVIIGHFLSFLYTHFSGVEWYSLLMIALVLLSFFSNLFCITTFEKGYKKLLLASLNLLLVYFFSRMQFSYTAGFLAVSAVILQVYGFWHQKNSLIVFSLLLLLLSSLVRFEMFIFTYVPFFLVFIFDIKKIFKPKIIYLGLLIIVVFKGFDYYSYTSDKEWKAYHEFNKYRGGAVANFNLDYSDASLKKKLNLSEKDITLIQNFIFTENITTEKLKIINQFAKQNNIGFAKAVEICFTHLQPYFIVLVIFLAVALLMKRKKTAGFILLHIFLIILTLKYVNVVQYRILFPSLFGMLFFFFKDEDRIIKPVFAKISFVFIGVTFLFALYNANRINKFSLRTLQNIRLIESRLSQKEVYILETTANTTIYSRMAFEAPKIKTISFGWMTNLPTIKNLYPSYNSNPLEMKDYPLIISEKNSEILKPYISNQTVYTCENLLK